MNICGSCFLECKGFASLKQCVFKEAGFCSEVIYRENYQQERSYLSQLADFKYLSYKRFVKARKVLTNSMDLILHAISYYFLGSN